jgi:hypothetical protein
MRLPPRPDRLADDPHDHQEHDQAEKESDDRRQDVPAAELTSR